MKATCRTHPASITIALGSSWNHDKDFFALMADAIKDCAWNMSGKDKADAKCLESVADAMHEAIAKADAKEQESIRNCAEWSKP